MKKLLPLLLLILLVPVLPAAATTWRAGLWQSKWSARYDWTGADPATDVERTPGVVMADVQATDANYASVGYSNAWSGAVTRWNQSNTMFAYTGQMWMEGGVKYTFGKILDDGVRIVVDGAQVMQHQTWNEWRTDSCTPAFTGWHDIEIRLCDEDGGKGPSNQNAWGNDRGLGWNATGVTSANLTDWNWFREDGATTRFRCADTNDAIAAGAFEKTVTGFDFAVSNRSAAAVAPCRRSVSVASGRPGTLMEVQVLLSKSFSRSRLGSGSPFTAISSQTGGCSAEIPSVSSWAVRL